MVGRICRDETSEKKEDLYYNCFADEPVHLGFGVALETDDLFRLRSQYLPLGKIGGKPAWLNPKNLPNSSELLCKNCEKPLCFLIQVYANSVNDPDHSFHRSIFVFVCRNPKCSKSNDASNLAAFRCALPRDNAFYSFDGPMDPDLDGDVPDPRLPADAAKLCETCGCAATKKCAKCQAVWYCSREHQALDWPTHKTTCGQPPCVESVEPKNPRNGFVFKEFGIDIDQEYVPSQIFDDLSDDDDEDEEEEENEEEKAARMKEFKQFIEKSKDKHPDMTREDLEAAVAEQEKDLVFDKFNRLLNLNPEQIIRYKRNGDPLPSTCRSELPEQIEPCALCGAPRRFEMQLMPHLLSLIDVDAIGQSIDWASVYIYTCSASCRIPNDGYAKEFVAKQDFV
ncbi:unnamed protein product [Caenorhabditis bovis]|uniref:MYND-type domain-containing protein n=1 Tax=Caenorhabditis bovis TaxID=2654633 RepID=A0A8S1EQF7_9PELO|nr:unnamed protein product [Caenorhabditis bovis]